MNGWTLVELLLTLPTLALIAGIVAAGIAVTARTTAPVAGVVASVSEAAAVLERMAIDVENAIGLAELTATTLELSVPDRTGNGADDRIRYAWSGHPGDPLTFRLNAQPVETIVPHVYGFDLNPVTVSAAASPLDAEFAVLAHHDGAPGAHTHDHTIEPNKWAAQYFEPTLPAGTTTWKIKRVRVMAKREADPTEQLVVRIETADASQQPSGIVLDEATIPEASLGGDMAWLDVDFTALNELDPAAGLCLVVAQTAAGGKAGKVQYEHGNPMTSGMHWLKSDDGGGSWSSPDVDKDLRFYVLGTYDAYVPAARQFTRSIAISIQPHADPASTMTTTCALLNPIETSAP